MAFHSASIRGQFPILDRKVTDQPLTYLDWAATGQMPEPVLEAMDRFGRQSRGNVHRGMHVLAEESTVAYENARTTVQKFLNAARPEEIVFTKSCTEAINLVARGIDCKKGDAIVVTELEHHSNIVPWLQLRERKGVEVLWVDCDERGTLNLDQLRGYLRQGNVKLVSVTAQSNVLGVCPPLAEIITMSHQEGALVLIDAAQSIAHHKTDVQALDCDFLAFSGHKLYGPTGIGVLYGKKKMLQSMSAFLGGGMMIREVTKEGFSAADLPQKFEAGTPPVTEAVGLAAAIDWISQFDWKDIEAHEQALIADALKALQSIPGITVLGPAAADQISGCISFIVDGVHPHDLTEILGRQGICLRAGHHCAQVLHKRLGVGSSTRLSVGLPTTKEEIGRLVEELPRAIALLYA